MNVNIYHKHKDIIITTFIIASRAYLQQLNPQTTPYYSVFLCHPNYPELRVFGCLCFPNTYVTSPHKLAPRSLPYVFLGYSDEHKGYRCFDPVSGRIHISRHVTFVEHSFPFATHTSPHDSVSTDPSPSTRSSTSPNPLHISIF